MERVCWTNKKKSYFKMSLWALGYVMSIFHCLNDYLMYGLMFDMPSGMIKLILCNVDFFFAFCWQMSYLSCLSVRWCIWCLWCQLIWLVYSSSWDCVFLYFSIFLCVLLCGWVGVCVCCWGGAEGPGSSLLYLFGQESFVPLGLRWPLLCLLSKPITRMKYKYINTWPN